MYGAPLPLSYIYLYVVLVFPFHARTDTNIIQCYEYFVQNNTVVSFHLCKYIVIATSKKKKRKQAKTIITNCR